MRVINGISKYDLYIRAFKKVLQSCSDDQEYNFKAVMRKLITYGVKAVNCKKEADVITMEEAENNFQFIELVKSFMGSLAPIEFMSLFPIRKEYDGHKWEMKDYFYTRDYLNSLDLSKPIGEEICNFLWEYFNPEISIFVVNMMGCIDNFRRLEGQPSLAEEWANTNGIKTYTLHTDNKGKQFLFDKETGKTMRIKPKVEHLKVVK